MIESEMKSESIRRFARSVASYLVRPRTFGAVLGILLVLVAGVRAEDSGDPANANAAVAAAAHAVAVAAAAESEDLLSLGYVYGEEALSAYAAWRALRDDLPPEATWISPTGRGRAEVRPVAGGFDLLWAGPCRGPGSLRYARLEVRPGETPSVQSVARNCWGTLEASGDPATPPAFLKVLAAEDDLTFVRGIATVSPREDNLTFVQGIATVSNAAISPSEAGVTFTFEVTDDGPDTALSVAVSIDGGATFLSALPDAESPGRFLHSIVIATGETQPLLVRARDATGETTELRLVVVAGQSGQ